MAPTALLATIPVIGGALRGLQDQPAKAEGGGGTIDRAQIVWVGHLVQHHDPLHALMNQVFQRERVQWLGAQGEALMDRPRREPRVDVLGCHNVRLRRVGGQAGRGIFGRQQFNQLALRVRKGSFDRVNAPDPDP